MRPAGASSALAQSEAFFHGGQAQEIGSEREQVLEIALEVIQSNRRRQPGFLFLRRHGQDVCALEFELLPSKLVDDADDSGDLLRRYRVEIVEGQVMVVIDDRGDTVAELLFDRVAEPIFISDDYPFIPVAGGGRFESGNG
jgi:hypothetical protein